MKVSALIAELQKYDPNADVWIWGSDCGDQTTQFLVEQDFYNGDVSLREDFK